MIHLDDEVHLIPPFDLAAKRKTSGHLVQFGTQDFLSIQACVNVVFNQCLDSLVHVKPTASVLRAAIKTTFYNLLGVLAVFH